MSESKFRGGHRSRNNAGMREVSLAKQVSGRSLSEVSFQEESYRRLCCLVKDAGYDFSSGSRNGTGIVFANMFLYTEPIRLI